jgi:hypothetical protein
MTNAHKIIASSIGAFVAILLILTMITAVYADTPYCTEDYKQPRVCLTHEFNTPYGEEN